MKNLLIKNLQTLAQDLDKIPSLKEVCKNFKIKNVEREIYQIFGNYKNFILESGIEKYSKPKNSEGNILCKCALCSKEILKYQRDLKRGNVFCSRNCAAIFNNAYSKIKEENHKIRNCLNCNKEFETREEKSKAKTCCSKFCLTEHHYKTTLACSIIRRKGANAYDNIRKNARSYSKYKFKPICMNCGYNKHYEVCHIKDIKDFDFNKTTIYEINSPENLLHLCPNCHWELDYGDLTLKEIKESKYYLSSFL